MPPARCPIGNWAVERTIDYRPRANRFDQTLTNWPTPSWQSGGTASDQCDAGSHFRVFGLPEPVIASGMPANLSPARLLGCLLGAFLAVLSEAERLLSY